MTNKTILDKLESVSIFKNGNEFLGSHSKNTIIVTGNTKNKMSPIAYIKKLKAITEKDWDIIKDKIQINLLK